MEDATADATPPDVSRIVFGPSKPEKREVAYRLRREMTPAERRLWQYLRAHRLAGLKFRRQQVIDGFVADFYCHAAALVVEVDGAVHDDRKDYDAARDACFTLRGLQVLRFPNEDVYTGLAGVLGAIYAAAVQRGLDLPLFVAPNEG